MLSSAQDEYVNAYRNSGGEAVFLDTYPNKTAIDQVTDLMQGQSPLLVASEEAALALADEEGGEFLVITPQRTRTPSVDAITHAIESGIYDTEGGAVIHAGEDYLSLGPLSIGTTSLPGFYVVDSEDNILKDLSDPGEAPVSQLSLIHI